MPPLAKGGRQKKQTTRRASDPQLLEFPQGLPTLTGSLTDWSRWADGRRPLSLVAACAWLAATVLAAYPIVGAIAGERYGRAGWISAAVAAGICWFASTAALVAGNRHTTRANQGHNGPQRAFYVLLYGMLFGFAIPLASGMILSRSVPQLAAGGIFGLMVVFYLLTLAVGTVLAVRQMSAADSQSRESRAG